MQRLIGLMVLAITGGVAVVLWATAAQQRPVGDTTHRGLVFGLWRFLYNDEAPPAHVIVLALSIVAFLVALVAVVESRIGLHYRRSDNRRANPLSPKVVMAQTRGRFDGEVTVTVVVPAHNERASLPTTLLSLRTQSRPPDRVIVISDNSSDDTVARARTAGAEVMESVDNSDKKAGALNQALARLLPELGANDLVMIMDADTMLDDGFLARGVELFAADRAMMGVGGIFYGEDGHGLLGQFQRSEYVRYGRELSRRRGRVFVLTGTATLFRPHALRTVAGARGTQLPGTRGEVYDTVALTEDNELTIALKSLGALIISPRECTVVTELMPTWRALWSQRLRWQRGALENLGSYGVTPSTLRYWAQQLGIGYGVFALWSYFLLLVLMVLCSDHWVWFPFWIGLGAIFAAERVITAWAGGWRARLLALSILPELVYDAFIQAAFVKGVIDMSFRREPHWRHLSDSDAAGEMP